MQGRGAKGNCATRALRSHRQSGLTHSQPAHGYWLAVAVMTALQAASSLAYLTVPVIAAAAAASFGLSPGLVGVYTGLSFLGSAMATLLTAGLSPRVGAVRMCQWAAAANVAGLLCLLPAEPLLLPLAALLIGAGYGPMNPAGSFLLARVVPSHRMSFVFSIKQTCVPIGYGLAGLVLPPVVLLSDWRGAVLVSAGLTAAVGLASQIWRPGLDRVRGEGSPFAFRRVLEPLGLVAAHPGLRRMAVCSLVFSAVQLGVASFLVVYLHEVVGMGLAAAGSVLAIANAAAVAGRVGWGWVADRLAARWVLGGLGLGMAASVALILTVSLAWPFALVAALSVALGATVIGWNGVFLAETARQSPEGKVSEATGGVMVITFLGSVIGPPVLSGLLAATESYAAGFALLAVSALGMAVAFFLPAKPQGDASRR